MAASGLGMQFAQLDRGVLDALRVLYVRAVLQDFYTGSFNPRFVDGQGDNIVSLSGERRGQVFELSREILMDEQNSHRRKPLSWDVVVATAMQTLAASGIFIT